ncbi:OmpA family protein [Solilutibacter pythonis]|nr:OmpA family protein [Lysobacter pythonis]
MTTGDSRSARIYFALGSSQLPVETGAAIAGIIEAMKADPALEAVVAGFHDASGNAEVNAEIAKQRAFNVRDALAAAGIDRDRVETDKPTLTTGTGDAAEARRVEVTLH